MKTSCSGTADAHKPNGPRAVSLCSVDAPTEIGLIIVATSTPDYATFPSTACLVQAALGCSEAGAYDLQAACAGFVYAREQARCWAKVNKGAKALVVGAETLSREPITQTHVLSQ